MSEKKILNVIIAEDEPDLREILGMFVESDFPAKIYEAGTGNEAVELIKKIGHPDLVISDFNMPQGNGLTVYKYVRENFPRVPFILSTSDSLDMHPEFKGNEYTGYVCKPFSDEELTAEIRRLFEVVAHEQLPEAGDYIPIKLDILLKIKEISKPLFIKISDSKYVKIVPAGSEFDQEIYAHIKSKSADHLFVSKSDYEILVSKYKKKIISEMMFAALKAKPSDAIKISSTAQDLVHSTVQNFGISEEAIEIAQKNIQLVGAVLESTKELSEILKILSSDEGEETINHALVLSYIVTALIKKAPSNIPFEGEILSMAAFFHDAYLDGNQIRNEAKFIQGLMQKSHLNKSDQSVVAEHIQKMVEKITEWKMAPGDLSTIIAQHHEKPDGSGFPNGLNADQIHELSACLIIAHEMVELNRFHKSMIVARQEFRKKASWFESEKFRKYANALLELLDDVK